MLYHPCLHLLAQICAFPRYEEKTATIGTSTFYSLTFVGVFDKTTTKQNNNENCMRYGNINKIQHMPFIS